MKIFISIFKLTVTEFHNYKEMARNFKLNVILSSKTEIVFLVSQHTPIIFKNIFLQFNSLLRHNQ